MALAASLCVALHPDVTSGSVTLCDTPGPGSFLGLGPGTAEARPVLNGEEAVARLQHQGTRAQTCRRRPPRSPVALGTRHLPGPILSLEHGTVAPPAPEVLEIQSVCKVLAFAEF